MIVNRKGKKERKDVDVFGQQSEKYSQKVLTLNTDNMYLFSRRGLQPSENSTPLHESTHIYTLKATADHSNADTNC